MLRDLSCTVLAFGSCGNRHTLNDRVANIATLFICRRIVKMKVSIGHCTRSAVLGISVVPVLLLFAACAERTQYAKCWHYHQGTWGNYTKWEPCPSNAPRPWEEAGR
jgi:hypothetical protein